MLIKNQYMHNAKKVLDGARKAQISNIQYFQKFMKIPLFQISKWAGNVVENGSTDSSDIPVASLISLQFICRRFFSIRVIHTVLDPNIALFHQILRIKVE